MRQELRPDPSRHLVRILPPTAWRTTCYRGILVVRGGFMPHARERKAGECSSATVSFDVPWASG